MLSRAPPAPQTRDRPRTVPTAATSTTQTKNSLDTAHSSSWPYIDWGQARMWLAAPTGFIPNRAGPKILLTVPTASTLTRARARTQLTDPITPIVTLRTTHTPTGPLPVRDSPRASLTAPTYATPTRSRRGGKESFKGAFSELTMHPGVFPSMQPLRAKPLSSVLTRLIQSICLHITGNPFCRC